MPPPNQEAARRMQENTAAFAGFSESLRGLLAPVKDLSMAFSLVSVGIQGTIKTAQDAMRKLSGVSQAEQERADQAQGASKQEILSADQAMKKLRTITKSKERTEVQANEATIASLENLLTQQEANTESYAQTEKALNEARNKRGRAVRRDISSAVQWLSSVTKTSQGMGGLVGKLSQFGTSATEGFTKASTQMSGAMKAAGLKGGMVMGGAVVAGLGVAVFAIEALMKRFEEAQGVARSFGGTMFESEVSLVGLTDQLRKSALAMAFSRISAEDVGEVSTILAKNYGLSAMQARRFTGSLKAYTEQQIPATARTLAYGKIIGLTNKEVGEFINTFGILGGDLRESSNIFERLAARAKMAGINTGDLIKATTRLGRANIFAKTSALESGRTLSRYGEAIMASNNALLDGANKAAIAAEAINSIADASARLELPTILAFGAAMQGVTGSMDQMLETAMKVPREEIFKRFMDSISHAAAPGSRMFARTVLAQQLGIQNLNSAFGVAVAELKAQKADTEEIQRETALARKTGHDMYSLQVRTTNTLSKALEIITTISQAAILDPNIGLGGGLAAFITNPAGALARSFFRSSSEAGEP